MSHWLDALFRGRTWFSEKHTRADAQVCFHRPLFTGPEGAGPGHRGAPDISVTLLTCKYPLSIPRQLHPCDAIPCQRHPRDLDEMANTRRSTVTTYHRSKSYAACPCVEPYRVASEHVLQGHATPICLPEVFQLDCQVVGRYADVFNG